MGKLRFMTAGESHGPCLTAIVEGLPAGFRPDIDRINKDMARRQQGYGRGGRMKIETDKAEVQSGIRFGETLGSPITLRVNNRDWQNWTGRMSQFGEPEGPAVTEARPGHADLVGVLKYDRKDARDILERASARETAARVAVGALCKEFLRALDIAVVSHVVNIGGAEVDRSRIAADAIGNTDSELNCCDPAAEEAMKAKIRAAMEAGDTLGGIFEVIVRNLPIGLGSHIQWDRRLDGKLAQALMSIQAIKGVEVGEGFGYASLPGSKAHDEMFFDEDSHVYRKTNHAGGLEGGITNGEELVVRACMKPIPTLMTPLHSVDIRTKQPVLASKERSDCCAVSAASVVGEAMVAITLAAEIMEAFGGDNIADIKRNIADYKARLTAAM